MLLSGQWVLHFSWGPTDTYAKSGITFNSDGTFVNGSATGKWRQRDGTVLLSFDNGPAKYTGTIDGNVGCGAMTTFTGNNGIWYIAKQGTSGVAPQPLERGSN